MFWLFSKKVLSDIRTEIHLVRRTIVSSRKSVQAYIKNIFRLDIKANLAGVSANLIQAAFSYSSQANNILFK